MKLSYYSSYIGLAGSVTGAVYNININAIELIILNISNANFEEPRFSHKSTIWGEHNFLVSHEIVDRPQQSLPDRDIKHNSISGQGEFLISMSVQFFTTCDKTSGLVKLLVFQLQMPCN